MKTQTRSKNNTTSEFLNRTEPFIVQLRATLDNTAFSSTFNLKYL